ncbi:type IV pili methyl-accepting chemotaxis transducer N-terminal domain-containing protein [Roseateles sp.]|uniref:type IV pili methyl-accepting chemotaxis transducer N-terminal domain-containing protein n=1 Tax=Roseateles sp. TaxID=1971397 RepID=UPI00286A14EE|nr:type IV pili methyl-accepting chemotaxis transducer N-terminal domain-containing protein [Roseateles sp.]
MNTPPDTADPATHLLLLCPPEAGWQALATPLAALGCTVSAPLQRNNLVHRALEPSPQALLLWAPEAAAVEPLLDDLAHLKSPLPIVCVAASASPAQRRRGLSLGVQVWLEQMPTPAELLLQLRWAGWQWQKQAALQTQLDERKWTDRAKGLLMAAQALDEAGAYQLLRAAAMQTHLRLGEVARSLVEAAQQAEALNLAGQQRMLSQRLVKLLAQRAAGIEVRRAKVLQDESRDRVDANLARLRQLVTAEQQAPLAALDAVWLLLRGLLVGKADAGVLQRADAAAEALLQLSEELAATIENSGGAGKPLRLVNLCGRQRMLSQRLAKDALLADLLAGREPALIAAGLDQFESGLKELEAAPLTNAEIQLSLAAVREEWRRLLRSLRDVQGPEAAAGLARSSELLLTHLDGLTGQYQQSLQVLLG